jgi:MOSC domain-containing protein YiiM
MTQSAWAAACSAIGTESLPWTARRANLLVDGIELKGKIGYDLRVGDALLTISGETRPCEVMEQAHPGLMAALQPQWRGGVTCRVTRSGKVAVGCEVVLRRNVIRQCAWVAYLGARRLMKRGRRAIAGLARKLAGGRHGASASAASGHN